MVDFLGILLIEILAVVILTEWFVRRLPRHLILLSRSNTVRADGSTSPRRKFRERRALRKVRWRYGTGLSLIFLVANLGLAALHTAIIPIPIGIQAMMSFRLSGDDFKSQLRESGVDAAYQEWLRSDPEKSAQDIAQARSTLWRVWPAIMVIAMCWALASWWVMRRVSWFVRCEFEAGILQRSEMNQLRDKEQTKHPTAAAC